MDMTPEIFPFNPRARRTPEGWRFDWKCAKCGKEARRDGVNPETDASRQVLVCDECKIRKPVNRAEMAHREALARKREEANHYPD